jgi:transcriptional regulator with PAS, ATPase and Fis domain
VNAEAIAFEEAVRIEPVLSAQRPRFQLRIERGVGPRSDVLSSEGRIVIGRSPQADMVLEHESVSPLHCEIAMEKHGFVLRDLGSRSGTWIHGIRVREVVLTSEAYIEVGETEISFGVVSGVSEFGLHPEGRFGDLIGDSDVMRAAFDRLARVATREITVLLEGESGTGKELAARAIHESSSRRDGPFVVVDCGAISPTLVESELFGHERGAYTGASHARPGAFVRAQGGSIFLDEIAELDLALQPRLLGVLERREVKPIGASEPISVNVRVIAAVNRDLRCLVNEGSFREDLYYRLAVGCVRLPALRERANDIPLLVNHLLEQHSQRDGVRHILDETVVRRLMLRPWPGNVRELRNVVDRLVAFGPEEIPCELAPKKLRDTDQPFKLAKAQIVECFEREYLASILERSAGNITAAAAAAELDRVHFLRLLDRHGLRKPRARRDADS